jgi:hypothetical protein
MTANWISTLFGTEMKQEKIKTLKFSCKYLQLNFFVQVSLYLNRFVVFYVGEGWWKSVEIVEIIRVYSSTRRRIIVASLRCWMKLLVSFFRVMIPIKKIVEKYGKYFTSQRLITVLTPWRANCKIPLFRKKQI